MQKTIRKTMFFICIMAVLVLLFAFEVYADDDITITVKSPLGKSTTLSMPETATVAEVENAISSSEPFSGIVFGDDGYWLYSSDANSSNKEMTDRSKTLKECGITSQATIYVEKDYWDTADEPIQLFGLTITGGKGGLEYYGEGYERDYYWNYYYKYICIRTDSSVTISGIGETNANVLINNDNSNVTFDNLILSCDDGACVTVNGGRGLNLTLKGQSVLTTSKDAALELNQGGSWIVIDAESSSDSLFARTTDDGKAGIGMQSDDTYFDDEPTTIQILGGIVTATGGSNAQGIMAHQLKISGGTTIANGGAGCDSGIYVYDSKDKGLNFEITGGAVKTKAISTNHQNPIKQNTVIFENGTGTVIGNAVLNADLTVENGEILNIPSTQGQPLTVQSGVMLHIMPGGIINNQKGTLANNGTIKNEGTINTICTDETVYTNENGGTVNYSHIGFTQEVADDAYAKTAATCMNQAVYYKSCLCGASSEDTAEEATFKAGDLAAHKWDEGVITLKPTVEKEGIRTYTCGICQTTKEDKIPKLKAEKEDIKQEETDKGQADTEEPQPEENKEQTGVKTGDHSGMELWMVLALVSGCMALVLAKKRKNI